MSPTRVLNLKTDWNGSLGLAPVCALLTVFAAAPIHAQSYQDLYDFDCTSGCAPFGRLTQGSNGNFYGTTASGGSNNFGTIFMLNPSGAGYTDLWDFDATSGAPTGGLTLASLDGNFYGTTSGTLFRFNPLTSSLTVLHQFSNTEGIPSGPPAEAKDKKLYGLNTNHTSHGIAYRLTVATGTYVLLPKSVPEFPNGPLFSASDGNLYGATASGGSDGAGTVFRMTTLGGEKTLYSFTDGTDGDNPNAPLAQGKDGNLYGTAYLGGFFLNFGTIFKLTLPSYSFSTAFAFDSTGGAGVNPEAGLLAATDGNFYGSTYNGGANGLGTLFELQAGGSFLPLFDFSGVGGLVSGAHPNTTLIEDTSGLFYGLTPQGGANGGGVFYTVAPPSPQNHITLCCNWFVILDQPVTILGQNLTGVINVSFGSVTAQFQPGSDTYLIAEVPSAAIDAPVTVTLATGEQLDSQQSAHILPKITNLDPSSGAAGTRVGIVGGGFAETMKVTFGGVATTNFTVVTPALIQATVPAGAMTGKVVVFTPNGFAASKETFTVN